MIIVKIMGGLGNQLFQYATARRMAKVNAVALKLDLSFYENPKYQGIYRLDLFNIQTDGITTEDELRAVKNILPKTFVQKVFTKISRKIGIPNRFNKKSHLVHKESPKPEARLFRPASAAYLEGWFSNPLYFNDARKYLLEELTLKKTLDDKNREIADKIACLKSVSIHVRRGDYLQNQYFGVLPIEYYLRAAKLISEKIKDPFYFVFSDDFDWVSRNIKLGFPTEYVGLNSKKTSYHATENDFADLELMRLCKHNIMANSSFSWWGSWLNRNPEKIVIAPNRWFNDEVAQSNYEKGTLLPKGWIKI